MSEILDYLGMFARLPFALRRFLREPLTLERAHAIVRERLVRRSERFLEIAGDCVYNHPRSPYLALLRRAGCELGDLRRMVDREGLESTLKKLRDAGVYVSFDEFKGRTPIVRPGLELPVTPTDFDNPHVRRVYASETSGSSGLARSVSFDLDYTAAGAVTYMLTLAGFGALHQPTLQWLPILPGGGIHFVLQILYLGQRVSVWHTPTGWHDSKYRLKYGSTMLYMLACLAANGARVPFPRLLDPLDALKFAKQVRAVLDSSKECLVQVGTSLAVRTCLAAAEAGIDLQGALFRIGGEPLTPAKASIIRATGARILVHYGGVDAGSIGLGCSNPVEVDDVHLNTSAYALITHPYHLPATGDAVPVLNLTQIIPSAPKILLNYQSDDYAKVSSHKCGCALETLGLTTHLAEIKSYTKLLGESVTLVGTEMVKILEEVLPARFGGTPFDYQMIEREDPSSLTRLVLLIHPRLEISEPDRVVQAILDALRTSSPTGDAARLLWERSQTLQIERRAPTLTPRGKFLPLVIERMKE